MPQWVGTAVIIAIIAAVCVIAVVSYIRRLSKGCCGTAADKETRLAPKRGDFPYSVTVSIGGMTCENCAARIENGFNRLDGVNATVDHKTGKAVIRSETPLSETTVRRTIIQLGYTLISIS